MVRQSEAYDFRNLYKITNKMVYNLFGNNLIPRYMLTAPDYDPPLLHGRKLHYPQSARGVLIVGSYVSVSDVLNEFQM